MNKKENGFSLIIVVIFMSIAALFVGYLMGSWLISFLVEDESAEIAEEQISTTNVNQESAQGNEIQPEEINNQKNNLTAPENGDETTDNSITSNKNQQQNKTEQIETETNNSSKKDIAGFAVQIGAFSNYNNALTVKNTVEELGYEIFITETTPHQVQVVGYSTRNQAESVLEELESKGYNGFIVVRE